MSILAAVVTILLALACLAWIWAAIVAARTAREVPRLIDRHPPTPATWPRLTAVVLTPDTSDAGRAALADSYHSLRADDYPDLEVLLVDGKGAAGRERLDELVAGDDQATALHLTERIGQVDQRSARQAAVQRTTGEWLLFLDAGAHVTPGALRQLVAFAINNARERVSLLPDIRSGVFGLDIALAAASRTLALAPKPGALVPAPLENLPGAGAAELFRRDVSTSVGTIAPDDERVGGAGAVSVPWSAPRHALAAGLQASPLPLLGRSLSRLPLAAAALTLLELSPWLALMPLGTPLRVLGLVALICQLGVSVGTAWWSRRPLLPAFVTPVGAALLLRFMVRADRHARRAARAEQVPASVSGGARMPA